MLDVKPTMGENWKCEMVGKGAFKKIEPYKERHEKECSPKESDVCELGSSLCIHATPLLCLLMETSHPWRKLARKPGHRMLCGQPCVWLSFSSGPNILLPHYS